MYQALLTRRYLTSQIMPLLASLAVMLCTAMVLIVWSVMGGFLASFVNQGRTLVGDVIIAWPNTGFAYYEDLASRLEKDPEVQAVAPMIEAFGMVGLPDGRQETVRLLGIDGPRYAQVTSYGDSIFWRALDKPLPKDKDLADWRVKKEDHDIYNRMFANAMNMRTDRLGNELAAARAEHHAFPVAVGGPPDHRHHRICRHPDFRRSRGAAGHAQGQQRQSAGPQRRLPTAAGCHIPLVPQCHRCVPRRCPRGLRGLAMVPARSAATACQFWQLANPAAPCCFVYCARWAVASRN